MKNKALIAWIVIGVLALIVAFTIFISTRSKSNINWDEHYTGDSKDPYGEYLLQELLTDKYFLNNSIIKQPLFRSLPASEDSLNRNYLFIGDQLYLNKQDEQALLTFIENGNTAFIAANELPYPIRYLLKTGNAYTYDSLQAFADEPIQEPLIDTTEAVAFDTIPVIADESYTTDTLPTVPTIVSNLAKETTPVDSTSMQYTSVISTAITVTFKPPVPDIKAEYSFSSPKNNTYKWKGIQKDSQLFATCRPLSYFTDGGDTLYNMIAMPYGKGMLYIHTNPVLFTNFFLKTKAGLDQTEHALSVLSNEKLYWDEFSKDPSGEASGDPENHTDYLKYILSIESLKWAWYLLISATLLYILFKSKRKQRIIPVIEQINNTSIEYVHTTGRLYAQLGNHRKLVQLNMRLFISMIHQKYGVIIKPEESSSIQWIALKSGIPENLYQKLFKDYKKLTIPGNVMKTKDLHRFYTDMQFIYQKIHI